MIPDAIRFYVRGFFTEATGNHIIKKLEEIGFAIKMACDGNNDTLGGIIETNIADVNDLYMSDVESVKDELVSSLALTLSESTGIFFQWQAFSIGDEDGLY